MDKLTPKQQRFVDEYLVDLNATQAAKRAGYSEKTAAITGFENLQKPNIQAALQDGLEKRQKRTLITQDQIITEIREIAQEARDAQQFSAALKGYELLGKHQKMWTDRVENSGTVNVTVNTGVPRAPDD